MKVNNLLVTLLAEVKINLKAASPDDTERATNEHLILMFKSRLLNLLKEHLLCDVFLFVNISRETESGRVIWPSGGQRLFRNPMKMHSLAVSE